MFHACVCENSIVLVSVGNSFERELDAELIRDKSIERLSPEQKRSRIAMVGDMLHTDILGGAFQGWSTVLVSEFSLFRGTDVTQSNKAASSQPKSHLKYNIAGFE